MVCSIIGASLFMPTMFILGVAGAIKVRILLSLIFIIIYAFLIHDIHGFVTRLTRLVPLVVQELPTLPEHLSSPPDLVGFLLLDLSICARVMVYNVTLNNCAAISLWSVLLVDPQSTDRLITQSSIPRHERDCNSQA